MNTKARKRVDLFSTLKGTDTTVDISVFKDSVLELFKKVLQSDEVDAETTGKLARLRARIEIELKDL